VVRVNHIYIIQISCSGFISKIHRVIQGKIPNRKCFKLGITSIDAPFVLMVELRQTGAHFATAGTGCGYDNQRSGSFNIIIFTVAIFTYNVRNICRITGDQVMVIYLDAKFLQAFLEMYHTVLLTVFGQDNTSYIETAGTKFIDQSDYIIVIGDA